MNDALNCQLTADWTIPTYAREVIFVESDAGTVKAEGARGLFSLPAPTDSVTVRYGAADGAALIRLRWRADTLGWDGSARIGGYIDALQIMTLEFLPAPLVALVVGGQPLLTGKTVIPMAGQRSRAPYAVPNFYDFIADDVPESVTTWLAFEDHPALTLAQDALVSKMRVHLSGQLASDESGLGTLFALPIVLESMTLFAT